MAAIAAAAAEEATGTQDHIINVVMARAIQADAAKAHGLFAWIMLKDQADYLGIFAPWLLEDVPQRLQAFLVEQDMVVVEDERIAIHPRFADMLTPLLAQADANAGQVSVV